MSTTTRVTAVKRPAHYGVSDAPLSFGPLADERPAEAGPGPRQLRLDGEAVFDLTHWCGTCPLVFERLGAANSTLSSESLQALLNAGRKRIDTKLVKTVSLLLPPAVYVPTLLSLRPQLVRPSDRADYFANEQVAHRGVNAFWGLPESPRTPYYRGGSWQVAQHDFLFEFVVPMVPPSWNDQDRVANYERKIGAGERPTVLAISILDRTQPHDKRDSHSGLIHFILDGHHKIEAAARIGAEISVLSMLSIDDSLADPEKVRGIPALINSAPVGL